VAKASIHCFPGARKRNSDLLVASGIQGIPDTTDNEEKRNGEPEN